MFANDGCSTVNRILQVHRTTISTPSLESSGKVCRRNMKLSTLFAIAALFYSALLSAATLELSDARTAMTCGYYHNGVKFAWDRPGGDWRDARDVAYGDEAFAQVRIARARTEQTVEWDVTDLARKWQSGALPSGGMYLRQLATAGSSAQFHSRESKQEESRPSLFVEWSDGTLSSLQPMADSTIACSMSGGLGHRTVLEVGNHRSTILVFPFFVEPGKRVRTARLVLHSHRQYGAPSDIGVFRLTSPFARERSVRQGLAAEFRADEGIDSHPAVVFATGFESSDWLDGWSASRAPKNAERVSTDDDTGLEPLNGYALKVTIKKGEKTGLNLPYRFQEKIGHEPEAMYFRYYLRLGNNWKPKVGGKMPGFAGTYDRGGWGGRMSDGFNGWSARGGYAMSDSLDKDEYALGFYVYHAGMQQKYGDSWGWGRGPTGIVRRNQWYCVEQYVKLNTPGKADGELKAWLDGNLVFERSDIRFRDTDDLRIETLWMNVYHGGTSKVPRDVSLFMDNVVVAREYIGPAG